MRILVCGGRDFSENKVVQWLEKRLNKFIEIKDTIVFIEGGATGADKGCKLFCEKHGFNFEEYKADWDNLSYSDARIKINRYGKNYDANAGSRRNKLMINQGNPKIVIAFPGGSGTLNMINQAKKANINVIQIEEGENTLNVKEIFTSNVSSSRANDGFGL